MMPLQERLKDEEQKKVSHKAEVAYDTLPVDPVDCSIDHHDIHDALQIQPKLPDELRESCHATDPVVFAAADALLLRPRLPARRCKLSWSERRCGSASWRTLSRRNARLCPHCNSSFQW